MQIVKKYSNESNIIDNGIGDRGEETYKVIFNADTIIGSKGETKSIVLYNEFGDIFTTYPTK